MGEWCVLGTHAMLNKKHKQHPNSILIQNNEISMRFEEDLPSFILLNLLDGTTAQGERLHCGSLSINAYMSCIYKSFNYYELIDCYVINDRLKCSQ